MKTTNWQPEHFPVGTIVLLENFERTDEGVSYRSPHGAVTSFAKVVVSSLIRNGLDSWLIRTNEFKEYTGQCAYNFNHVHSIVKRGTGKIEIESRNVAMINLKKYVTYEPLAKGRYYWHCSQEILDFLVARTSISKTAFIKKDFWKFIMQQSFIRKEKEYGHNVGVWFSRSFQNTYSGAYSADKKKLNRFIKQNINRWITPMKEIRALADAEAKAEQDRYFQEALDDFDREFEAVL